MENFLLYLWEENLYNERDKLLLCFLHKNPDFDKDPNTVLSKIDKLTDSVVGLYNMHFDRSKQFPEMGWFNMVNLKYRLLRRVNHEKHLTGSPKSSGKIFSLPKSEREWSGRPPSAIVTTWDEFAWISLHIVTSGSSSPNTFWSVSCRIINSHWGGWIFCWMTITTDRVYVSSGSK